MPKRHHVFPDGLGGGGPLLGEKLALLRWDFYTYDLFRPQNGRVSPGGVVFPYRRLNELMIYLTVMILLIIILSVALSRINQATTG